MSVYPSVILALAAVASFIGLQNLVLALYTRRRLNLWVGLLGLADGLYSVASFGLYTSTSVQVSSPWQLGQLYLGAGMLTLIIYLGLDYLGRLSTLHLLTVVLPTVLAVALLPVGELGLADASAVKHLSWLGLTYHERALGPVPRIYFAFASCWVVWITILLGLRARRGSRGDRIVAGVFGLWWVASTNDMLVAAGVYHSLYLVEFAFFAVAGIMAALLLREQHQSGVAAESRRRELAAEVQAKDRDLAEAQARLTEAAKLVAVGRLAASVAHEVNNPLTYLRVSLELLERELWEDEELVALVRQAQDGVSRISKVVMQLYGFSRQEATPGPGRVREAVDSAASMARLELEERAELVLDLPDLPAVGLNEEVLAQVILGLLINAAQSIPPGRPGENRVTLRGCHLPEQDLVELVVQDTGSGIPEPALPHVFEPFFTTKKKGEGVGLTLAIARTLLQRAGGGITAENVPSGGARFMIRIPCHCGETPTDPGSGKERGPHSLEERPARLLPRSPPREAPN